MKILMIILGILLMSFIVYHIMRKKDVNKKTRKSVGSKGDNDIEDFDDDYDYNYVLLQFL